MKKALKFLLYFLISIAAVVLILFTWFYLSRAVSIWSAQSKMGPPADTLYIDCQPFRDLNKNGSLDLYEDDRVSVDERVEDLLSQMTVEEKAGLFYHSFITPGENGELAGPLDLMNLIPVESALFNKKMHFFNLFEKVHFFIE